MSHSWQDMVTVMDRGDPGERHHPYVGAGNWPNPKPQYPLYLRMHISEARHAIRVSPERYSIVPEPAS